MDSTTEEEVPTVKVNVMMDGPHIIVTPLDIEGSEVLQRIVDGMPNTLHWHFQGSEYLTPGMKDKLIGVRYACGGTEYERQVGNVHMNDYLGAVKVHFDLTEVEDERARYAMRNYGFISSVVMESDSSAEGLRLRAGFCKTCRGPLSRFIELEWTVCDTCSAVCDHEYKEMVGHANGQLAFLPCCTKCGRGDPNWEPSADPIEDAIRTVTEGGLDVLMLRHPDGTSTLISEK